MNTNAIGLDIGGANLKWASTDGSAYSKRFAVWKNPERLREEIAQLASNFPEFAPIGVTMTAELCDCFRTKREGVRRIVEATEQALPDRKIRYWSTSGRFLSPEQAFDRHLEIAAANWHAQATFALRFVSSDLSVLIDMGSTTTDVIPLINGTVAALGLTDVDRMKSGELLYVGSRRTPLCAILPGLTAEFFATLEDVNVLLGQIPEDVNHTETADSRPMTREFARERLSRMLGGDSETVSQQEIEQLARRAVSEFERRLRRTLDNIQARFQKLPRTIITSGSGEFMLKSYFEQHWPNVETVSLSQLLNPKISECACAYSVALLCQEQAT